jgi:hypothetical protein
MLAKTIFIEHRHILSNPEQAGFVTQEDTVTKPDVFFLWKFHSALANSKFFYLFMYFTRKGKQYRYEFPREETREVRG